MPHMPRERGQQDKGKRCLFESLTIHDLIHPMRCLFNLSDRGMRRVLGPQSFGPVQTLWSHVRLRCMRDSDEEMRTVSSSDSPHDASDALLRWNWRCYLRQGLQRQCWYVYIKVPILFAFFQLLLFCFKIEL